MPKKKNKKPQVSDKLQQAQKFNDFKKRLYLIAEACNAQEALKLIPKREIEIMFFARFKPFDIIAADGQKLSVNNYKILKQIINYFLKNDTFSFFDGGTEVNLYEYYYVGNSLRAGINGFKDEKFKGVDELIKAFKPLIEKHDAPDGPHHRLFEISNTMAALLSRINKGYWLFHFHMVSTLNPFPEFRTCFKAEFVAPERLYLTLGGNKRPVYRVGWPIFGQRVSWAQVTPEQLKIESAFNNLKINVYIQSHAIQRIQERLDCFSENINQFILYQNIINFEIVTNHRGQQLLTYKIDQTKLGYLVFEYIQGAVIIKTFLLLTHNDTPEGEKLNKLLRLEKDDRQFLELDKLSNFVKSDIPNNKALYKNFEYAGCTDLFNVNTQYFEQTVNENIHAALIEEYINTAKIESEVEFFE